MPTYGAAGLRLRTEVALPELPTADDAPDVPPGGTFELRLGPVPPEPELPLLFEQHRRDGTLWSRLCGDHHRVHFEFPGQATFAVDLDHGIVVADRAPTLGELAFRHLVVDQLVPHLLAAGGDLVLHASAVLRPDGALAFTGPSGAGKSSLAAAYTERGAALLTDDYLRVLDDRDDPAGPRVAAAQPALRLWEDSATRFAGADGGQPVAEGSAKRRVSVAVDRPPAAVDRLQAIVVLGAVPEPGAPDVALERLRGRDAVSVLLGQAFRIRRPDVRDAAAELDRLVAVVARVPVLLMEHRRAYELLPEVLVAVDEAVRAAGANRPPRST